MNNINSDCGISCRIKYGTCGIECIQYSSPARTVSVSSTHVDMSNENEVTKTVNIFPKKRKLSLPFTLFISSCPLINLTLLGVLGVLHDFFKGTTW